MPPPSAWILIELVWNGTQVLRFPSQILRKQFLLTKEEGGFIWVTLQRQSKVLWVKSRGSAKTGSKGQNGESSVAEIYKGMQMGEADGERPWMAC